ncbi:hypothetical protein AB0O76_34590 [Streptomyces sp. NPDC086554]|uniref:hypothetical protein n=1 Tax=Streptomyces sp. NPDC086554 TaxID=3154864 RepID=UPI00342F81C3
MPHREIATLVGILFITSTITFLIGDSLVREYFSSTSPRDAALLGGVFLEGYTALAVATIGFALHLVLRPYGRVLSAGYFALRGTECAVIILTGIYFAASRNEFDNYDLTIYAFSGAAGLVLSYLLLRSGLVAGWLRAGCRFWGSWATPPSS